MHDDLILTAVEASQLVETSSSQREIEQAARSLLDELLNVRVQQAARVGLTTLDYAVSVQLRDALERQLTARGYAVYWLGESQETVWIRVAWPERSGAKPPPPPDVREREQALREYRPTHVDAAASKGKRRSFLEHLFGLNSKRQ